jgi:hypothetical protein
MAAAIPPVVTSRGTTTDQARRRARSVVRRAARPYTATAGAAASCDATPAPGRPERETLGKTTPSSNGTAT